ncbi:MAG TPA: agmatine deiminase family protein [Nocardioides sp.]|uniref:agmatine deiminase family protein n=1 Tax=Nocardioides sp. TaxID=35761 RepID=UPI002EDBA3D0
MTRNDDQGDGERSEGAVTTSVGSMEISRRGLIRRAGLLAGAATVAGTGLAGPFWKNSAAVAGHGAVRTPADFETHARMIMAWPYKEQNWTANILPGAQREWAGLANNISQFEPVTAMVAPGQEAAARAALGARTKVNLVTMAYDNDWTRDYVGPSVFIGGKQTLTDWYYNCYGMKFGSCEAHSQLDDAANAPLSQYLGLARRDLNYFVLEGGAVVFDGQGTCFTTESVMLNSNRNPGYTKQQTEDLLKHEFGCSKVIWLVGDPADAITDGHVDMIAQFVGAPTATQGAKVLHLTGGEPGSATYAALQENKRILQTSTDAKGRPFRLYEFNILPPTATRTGHHSYVNVTCTNNNGMMVPTLGAEPDAQALALLRSLFPEKNVVGNPMPNHSWAGGGAHCITQAIYA